ncbi:tryptophan-rich sensory protein [Marinicella sp. S1101]|uniref:TspO/MBR family protein n=1 Tax=Marinicella marina TaxID=2996016 RepID=UPI002260FBAD|nr:TspO/MBR family protein [Marinicella marina]MCX7554948.1 tryptophan-rich sensory protein [Marinicella marina]MDJ1141558.1 TspO/MBR family protein [Marinicella marina]
MTKQQQILGLLAWIVLCFAASAIGAVASIKAQSFYVNLIRPDWAPPGWLFGPVWTVLYALMAIAAWLVWRQGGFKRHPKALSLFLLQLGLNALWSWLFFAWMMGFWSFVNILALWLLILLTLLSFFRIKKLSGLLLVPYLLWVSFAAVLNLAMWQLNPSILG